MTDKEIRDKVLDAERNLTDAQRRYSRHPSTEARNDIRHAADSLRWWAIQLSATPAEVTR